ncbi:vanadium-dependent haloperoxidase [Nocardiopsis sediminis]|uniref:Vanadium-dependent haloperoxidase n=1 Tax=Nocardiopsis sediminis TaxID=1778267 RepID=A0ABV8FJP6_9ACTN
MQHNVNSPRSPGLPDASGGGPAVGVAEAGTAEPAPTNGAEGRVPVPSLDGRGFARRARGYRIRIEAAHRAYAEPFPRHRNNGEHEEPYLASYSKGLPHDEYGEVDLDAYALWNRALAEPSVDAFERVPRGLDDGRPQLNPLSAFGLDVEGPDTHGLLCPPAPRMDSPEFAAELGEVYWMALLRDVHFVDFDDAPALVQAAADGLSAFSGYAGPTQGGRVTPRALFRGTSRGDLAGPFISQFLLRDVHFGTHTIRQRQDTIEPVDYVTDFGEWLAVQRGAERDTERDYAHTRYIQTPRDLAHYVHYDQAYQAYLNAALILLTSGIPNAELLDAGNPYRTTRGQMGFATFGAPHILTLLAEVDARALKANLYQQYVVHRRARPEAIGGRIEVQMRRDPGRYDGLIHPELLESDALERTRAKHGTYLLPQALGMGSPMSPEYPAGHLVVAGACTTMLKAFFNEDCPLPDPVVPDRAGTGLVPYTGSDAGRLTVGGELNKLAANIAAGRCMSGVHARPGTYQHGIRVGEQVAIGILRDQKPTTHEKGTFGLTTFDGERITI